ncbi:hypothetical protein D3C87_1809470 [compost metagenome]
MQFPHTRSHHALSRFEAFGNNDALGGDLPDAHLAILQLEFVAVALHNPDMWLIARAVIRVKHRFDWDDQGILPRACREIGQIDGDCSADAAHDREIIRARQG